MQFLFVSQNELLNSMEEAVCMYVPATMGKVLVFENVGFYWSNVDFSLIAQPKRRDVWIPKNCLMMQTICPLRDQMAARGGHWQLPHGHIENLTTCGSCSAWKVQTGPCFLTMFMTTYIHTALTFRKLPGHFQSNNSEMETKRWGCCFSLVHVAWLERIIK